MRGLTIVVAAPDPARFRTALGMAAAQAALGGPARLFLEGAATSLIGSGEAGDAAYEAAGMPTMAALLDTCLALGARVILCQSGLALAGLGADAIDPRVETGGMTGLMATLGQDRLVVV